ncbi:fimbrial protein [Collimonas sp. NPDC087041]|uniref:fimbrial protein n=1 Tax=Collimonas sp. NPDC087041 TaxID=3363960 RepID=UPI00382D652D
MKKKALIIALLFAAGFTSNAVLAADGTITFTGSISSKTCQINGSAPGSGSHDIDKELPSISADSLATPGRTDGSTGFHIDIGATGDSGCPDGTRTQISFDPLSPLINPVTGNLKNTGTATNVEVQIFDLNGGYSQMHLFNNPVSREVVVVGNKARLDFTAQYIATGGPVTGGSVITSVLYSVVMN